MAARFFALLAASAAAVLLGLEAGPLRDIVLRADPTLQGSFSLLHARPFLSAAAHGALLALALHVLVARTPVARAARLGALVCALALGVEILSFGPCLFAGGSLCGLFYILTAPFASLAMLAGFAVYLAAAGSRWLVRATAAGAALCATAAVLAYWRLTPGAPADCASVSPEIKRDACLMSFALRTSDEALCDQIVFDSSRWSCLYRIAERKGNAALCEKIVLPCRNRTPGPACDPATYSDTCFIVVARKLKEARLCDRIGAPSMQDNCRNQIQDRR